MKINFFLLVLLIFLGCKDDIKSGDQNAIEEEIFMDDYDPLPYKWGYIDTKGKLVIGNIFDDNRDFAEGLAAVNLKGKWGYIDRRGEIAITPEYRTAQAFSEGLAVVQRFDRTYITIDNKGKEISRGNYDEQHIYIDGRSKVKVNNQYRFVNQDGIHLDSLSYRSASNFSNDIAVVEDINGYHVIDVGMNRLSSRPYDKIYQDSTRYWKYRSGKTYGYLDSKQGFKEWRSNLQKASKYIDNIACIEIDGKSYILNAANQTIEVPYNKIRNLTHGRVAYQYNGKHGILDASGKVVTPPIFDGLYEYREGRIGFQMNNLWGYLDIDGNEIIPALYPLVWDYHEGLTRCIANNGIGFMDLQGKLKVPGKYIEVRDFYEGLARVQVFR